MFWRWSTCTRTKPSHLNSPQLLWSPLLLVSHTPQRYFYSYFFLQNFFIYIFFNLEKILGKLWLYCHGSDQSLKKAKKNLGNYSSTLLSPLLTRRQEKDELIQRTKKKLQYKNNLIFNNISQKKIKSFYKIPPNRKRKN